MTSSFFEHMVRDSAIPLLLAVLLVSEVIVIAICLNPRVRTAVRLGRFGFFLETDRSDSNTKIGIGAPRN